MPRSEREVTPTFKVLGSRIAEPPPFCDDALSCPKVGPDAKLTLVGGVDVEQVVHVGVHLEAVLAPSLNSLPNRV